MTRMFNYQYFIRLCKTSTHSLTLQACQLSRFYRESHDFSASHTVSLSQANLTGCLLCGVNICKCYSNGASDADFLPQQMKNVA